MRLRAQQLVLLLCTIGASMLLLRVVAPGTHPAKQTQLLSSLHKQVGVNAAAQPAKSVPVVLDPLLPPEDAELQAALLTTAYANGGDVQLAFVCFFNLAWMDMTLNMLFSLLVHGGARAVLLLAADDMTLQACRAIPLRGVTCVMGARFVPGFNRSSPLGTDLEWNTADYTRLTWARPRFLYHALSQLRLPPHLSIVMLDADMVFVRDTLPSLSNACGRAAAFACVCEKERCNMGFHATRVGNASAAFFHALLQHESDTRNDQLVYHDVEPQLPDVEKCCLDWAQHWQSCSWSHPLDDAPTMDASAVSLHAVCLVGQDIKRNHFKARKVWFLPDAPLARMLLFRQHRVFRDGAEVR